MLSAYFFLVAEASAASSAVNTMSFGTFFSRASASTSSSTSLPFIMTLSPIDSRHQPCLVDVRKRNRVRAFGRLEAQDARVHAAQDTLDAARVPDRLAQPEL